MKRYIRLVALCMALVCLISAPASAAESTNVDNWVNLLDYGTANDSGSNSVSLPSGTTEVRYYFPSLLTPGYIDALVWCDHSFTAKNNGSQALTVLSIGNNLYRIYGSCPTGYTLGVLRLIITVSSDSTFEVKSLRVCTVQGSSHFAEKGTLRVTGGNLSSTYSATQSSTTSTVKCTFPHGSSYSQNMFFTAQVYLNDWRKYDYLDFYLYLYVDALESITCMMGNVVVPLSVQYIDSSESSYTSIAVVARVDLTGLDRSSSSTPILTIRGSPDNTSTVSTFEGHYITLQSVSGYVCPEVVDASVSWIQKLIDKLGGWFALLQSRVDIIGSQLVVNLNTITNSIKTEVKNITDRLDSLIHPDSTDSDDFSDSMASQATEMEEANDTLDSVTKPPVDDLDPSVDDIVPAEDVANFTSVFAAIFENNIFLSVFLMSFTLAMVSYVLYGKR